MDIVFIILFGLIVGSFLTVCIYRLPFSVLADLEPSDPAAGGVASSELDIPLPPNPVGQSLTISSPKRSFCTACGAQLRWYHNIPLFSWLALGGKCSSCGKRISARYPCVELLSALCALLCVWHFGLSIEALIIYVFCASLIVISFIDYDYYIIPNVISYPGFAIGLALSAANHFLHWFSLPLNQDLYDAGLGILAGAGFLYVVSEVYLRLRKIEGLGMGDVKLLAMTGAFFGPQCALFTIFVGSLLGSMIGLVFIVLAKKGLAHALPFGPYLASATILYIFTWDKIALFLYGAL